MQAGRAEEGASRACLGVGVSSPFTSPVEGIVEELKASVRLSGLVALGKPLHEMHLPLVLPGLGALARAALAGEGHVPALVLGILQRCVVVLQDDLREDAVLAFAIALRRGQSGVFKQWVLGQRDSSYYPKLDQLWWQQGCDACGQSRACFSHIFSYRSKLPQISFSLQKLGKAGIAAQTDAAHCSLHLQCDDSTRLQAPRWLVPAFTSTAPTGRFLPAPISAQAGFPCQHNRKKTIPQ